MEKAIDLTSFEKIQLLAKFIFEAKSRGYRVTISAEVGGVSVAAEIDPKNSLAEQVLEDTAQNFNALGLRLAMECVDGHGKAENKTENLGKLIPLDWKKAR